jgi:hypothetical protein
MARSLGIKKAFCEDKYSMARSIYVKKAYQRGCFYQVL